MLLSVWQALQSAAAAVWVLIFPALQSLVVATWAAAIGTIGATWVALWLALGARKIKLKKSFSTMSRFSETAIATNSDPHQVFTVSITNVGHIPITVSAIMFGCKRPLFSKRRLLSWRQKSGKYDFFRPKDLHYPDSGLLPATLAGGTDEAWHFSQQKIVSSFAKYLETEQHVKLLRCIITTMHGDIIVITPDTSVVKVFIKALRKKHAKSATTEK